MDNMNAIMLALVLIIGAVLFIWQPWKDLELPSKNESKLDDEHQILDEPVVVEKAEKAPVKVKKPSVRKPRTAKKKVAEENVETQ